MMTNKVNTSLRKTGSFRAQLGDAVLTRMLDYWCGLRHAAGNRTPGRRALDPLTLPRDVLGHLQLHHRMDNGRFRCRLSGTTVCQQLGRDATGWFLDEVIHPSALPGRLSLFNRAIEGGMPIAYSGTTDVPGHRGAKAYKRLLLPFRDQDGSAFVLSVMAFQTVALVDPQHLHQAMDVVQMTPEEAMTTGRNTAAVA